MKPKRPSQLAIVKLKTQNMKKFLITLTIGAVLCAGTSFGGSYSKETKAVAPAPCPEWYSDNEWNVNLWGSYVFTNTDYNPNVDPVDLLVSTDEGKTVLGTFDKYIGNDHAWGGGGDVKYFWHRYFGFGVEGFVLSAHKNGFDIFRSEEEQEETGHGFFHERTHHSRAIGAVLGTFTLRYPVPCTRFAPYAYAGVGAIFGGGESDSLIIHEPEVDPGVVPGVIGGGNGKGDGDGDGEGEGEVPDVDAHTRHFGGETQLVGHFGFGLETRITRHIGWMTDIGWGVIDGPKNNFTMIRTGINFAF